MGGFSLVAETVVSRLRTRKTEVLLAYLALNPTSHSRESLVERFWPKDDPQSGRQKLRLALNSIRSAAGSALVATREAVQISLDEVDLLIWEKELRAAMAAQDIEQLSQIADQYQAVLPAHEEDFAQETRRETEMLLEEGLRTLLKLLERDRSPEVVDIAAKLIELNPFDEEVHRTLLDNLQSRGRRRAIEQHLARMSEWFQPLPPEFAHLVTQLLRNDVTQPSRLSSKLVAQPSRLFPVIAAQPSRLFSPLIGRESVLEHLHAKLLGPDEPIVLTLVGPPGVGKTRLSREMMPLAADEEIDYVFVPLAGLRDAKTTEEAIVHALSPETEKLTLQDIASQLAPTLLVLDNWEQLEPGTERVLADLTPPGSSLRVLVTSQRPTEFPNEEVFPLAPLDTPRSTGHNSSASERLFLDRARKVLPDLRLTEDTEKFIADICLRLGGLPLAIELTAKALDVLTLPQIAESLRKGMPVKFASSATNEDRHRMTGNAVRWSVDLLPSSAKALLTLLAGFPSSFAPEAIAAIFGEEALSDLRLVNVRSLITQDADSPAMRYRLLEPIKAEIYEPGNEPGAAYAQYFLNYARSHQGHLPAGLRGAMDDEVPNLERSIEIFNRTEQPELAAELVRHSFFCWMRMAQYRSASSYVSLALDALPESALELRISLTGFLGSIEYFRGNAAGSEPAYRAALELAHNSGDPLLISGAQVNVALSLVTQGRHSKAEPLLIDAEHFLSKAGIPRKHVSVLFLLSDTALYRSNGSEARGQLDRAIQICVDEPALRPYLAIALRKTADILWIEGDLEEALSYSLRSDTILEETEESHLRRVESTASLVWMYSQLGRLDHASDCLRRIVESFHRPNIDQAWMLALRAGAAYAAFRGNRSVAGLLLGAAERIRTRLGLAENDLLRARGNEILAAILGKETNLALGATLSIRETSRLFTQLLEG